MNKEYFVNRGGVVLKKEFLGFESIHRNNEDLMEWYKVAYPREFGMIEEDVKPKLQEDAPGAPVAESSEAKTEEGSGAENEAK